MSSIRSTAAWVLACIDAAGLEFDQSPDVVGGECRQDLRLRFQELHLHRLFHMAFLFQPSKVRLDVPQVAVDRNRADALSPRFGNSLHHGRFGFSGTGKRLECALVGDHGFRANALEVYSFLKELREQFHGRTQRLKFGSVRSKLLILLPA